jgi:nucleoporin GLE1
MPESFARSHTGLLDSIRQGSLPTVPRSRETSVDIACELSRLRVNADDEFLVQLEKNAAEAEKRHVGALAAAAAEHQRIRQSAEAARAKHEELIRQERIRRKEEEQRELDKLRKERADKELAQRRWEAEQVQKEEAEARKHTEAVRVRAEAESRRRAEQERHQREQAAHERQRLEKEALARREQDDRAREELRVREDQQKEQQNVQIQPHNANLRQSSRTAPSSNAEQSVHTQNLEMHRKLKELRRVMVDQGKQHPSLKKQVGDWRREIRKRVGQLTGTKGANKAPVCPLNTVYQT